MEHHVVISECLIGGIVNMKNIILKILKESTNNLFYVDKDIKELEQRLKKLYPKIDIYIPNRLRPTLKIYTTYDWIAGSSSVINSLSSLIFYERGLIIQLMHQGTEPPYKYKIGQFTDIRDYESGEYLESDESVYEIGNIPDIVKILDKMLEDDYYGTPQGKRKFDWRSED